jgi:hypothetical protein
VDLKPKLSIVIPAFAGFDAVALARSSWEAQTRRRDLEILIVCPEGQGPTPEQRAALAPGQIVVDTGAALTHQARAMAIQRASADYIVLAEDHCLPDPGWADAILHRIEEGWDVIGPVFRPGHRSFWADAGFLLGNGQWMVPTAGGPVRILSGLNVTIRARLMLDLGEALADELTLPAFLVRRLAGRGCRLYLEDRAGMLHFDVIEFLKSCEVHLSVGAGFGDLRTRHWPLPARCLYLFAAPIVALLHWKRAVVQYRRAGAAAGLRPVVLASALVLAGVWALGEAAGAWMPSAWVARQIWRDEVRPVRMEDIDGSAERKPARAVAARR